MTDTLNVRAIPHREPFLFVDEILEVTDDRIVTSQFIVPDSDFLRGHFPGNPVMPGVLLCECCFQAGALLLARRTGTAESGDRVPLLTRIQDARFKRVVQPGETVIVEVTLTDIIDSAYFLKGRATVNDQLALRVTFACMLADAESNRT